MVPCILFETCEGRKGFSKVSSPGIISVISGGQGRLFRCGAEQHGVVSKEQFSYLGYFKVL